MRRWLVVIALAGCGDDLGEAPATLVRVTTSQCDGCRWQLDLYDSCNNFVPPLDTAGHDLEVSTSYASTEIVGLVQVQYVARRGYEQSQLDFLLLDHGIADVPAILALPGPPLYRMRPDGDVFDVDVTRLTSAEYDALHFTYVVGSETVTEDHVFDRPHQVVIDASSTVACCSAGGPRELGVVLAVLLIRPRRRRKLRV